MTPRDVEAFGTRLRTSSTSRCSAADLRGVVRDTVQPADVSVWRGARDEARLVWIAVAAAVRR